MDTCLGHKALKTLWLCSVTYLVITGHSCIGYENIVLFSYLLGGRENYVLL